MKLKKLFFIITTSLLLPSLFALDGHMEIDALEAKKKELVSVRNGNPSQENEILLRAKQDYEYASNKIDQELLRIAETDANGNMLADVRKRRAEEKLAIKAEIDRRAQSEIAALKGGDTSYENQLLTEIRTMEKELQTVRVIDSFEYPELLSLKSYAGDKYYWNTTAKFYIGNHLIFTQNIPLYYENISGKKAVKLSNADEATYNDYLDTVDYYDQNIRYNDGSIVLEIEYVISACDKSLPSTYNVKINKMNFVNKTNNKVIQSVTPPLQTYTLKITPAVDIRTLDERTGYTGNKTISSVETYNGQTGNKTVSSQNVPINQPIKKVTDDYKGRFLVGGMIGTIDQIPYYQSTQMRTTVNAFAAIPLGKNIFLQADLGMLPTPYYMGDYVNETEAVFEMMFGLGCNYKANFFGYKPNFYFSASCGFGLGDMYISSIYADYLEPIIMLGKLSTGIDFPIGKKVVLTSDFSFWFLPERCTAVNYGFGCSIDLN